MRRGPSPNPKLPPRNRISELRERQGFSQADFATAIGASEAYVKKLEARGADYRDPSDDLLLRMADVLAVYPWDLLLPDDPRIRHAKVLWLAKKMPDDILDSYVKIVVAMTGGNPPKSGT